MKLSTPACMMLAFASACVAENNPRDQPVPKRNNVTILLEEVIAHECRPLTILERPEVIEELRLTDEQRDEVELVRAGYPSHIEVLTKLMRGTGKTFNDLGIDQAKRKGPAFLKESFQAKRDVDNQLREKLTRKQFRRLQQLYIQDILRSRFPAKLTLPLDLGISIEPDASKRIHNEIKKANSGLREQIHEMRWKRYRKSFEKILGRTETEELFGGFVKGGTTDVSKNPR